MHYHDESGVVQPFRKETREKIAACEAVGLAYWSDHPTAGCMWAVDDNQQPHVVRWYRKTNEVALQHQGEPRNVRYFNKYGRAAYWDEYPVYDDGQRKLLA
jgi:hypothetical protein